MTDLNGPSLLSMADEIGRALGGLHPGRPAFSALWRAHDALTIAARELEAARRTYAPVRGAPVPSGPGPDAEGR